MFSRAVKEITLITICIAYYFMTCHSVGGANFQDNPSSIHCHGEWQEKYRPNSQKIKGSPRNVHPKNPQVASHCNIFYLLVSTVDGRVSALDLEKKGILVWSIQADARPLYSSSLASMEITHNGKNIRIIPSLDGALYQFDGETVELVPLSAESLLSSTNRLSDDTMIVGSKDMRNLGVDLQSGKVQFTCGSEGCSNYEKTSEDETLEGNNCIVITRSTQLVRSVDMKNGNEKWNFSVGQHQIRLPPAARPTETDDSNDNRCPGKEKYEDVSNDNLLQLLVPEGRIVALNKTDSSKVAWEYKFDSPIAKAWLLRHDKLEEMNLFDGQHIPSLSTYTSEDSKDENIVQPLLYIGSHQQLLYIQSSPQFESEMKRFTSYRIGSFMESNIKVSWRPYLNTASVRTPIFGGNRPQISYKLHSSIKKPKGESTSLTVWYEDYPFDSGYFLYPEFCDRRLQRKNGVMLIEDFHSANEANKTWFKVYLWLFWKEVIFLNVAAAIGVHFVHNWLLRFFKKEYYIQKINGDSKNIETISSSGRISVLENQASSSGLYMSRFATDFDCLHRLGKGGFGVVFEAVNKVDDQHYAIKRITLPKSEGAKEKVLREVKALAKLEHAGIVRYFNAWVESPPIGWQEEQDRQLQIMDTSGSTSYSKMVSHAGHFQPEQSDHYMKEEKNKNNKNDLNKIPTYQEQGDSVVLFSQNSSNAHLLKQSGSEESSVHSDFHETSNSCEKNVTNFKNNLHQFDLANTTGIEETSLSFNYSKSSIPFSNYFLSSSFQDLSGDSINFESTDNRPSLNSSITHYETKSSSDSVVFEKSIPGNLYINEENDKHIRLHEKNDSEDNAEKKYSIGGLSGTQFFLYIQMQLYCKETLKDWLSNNTLMRSRHKILDIFDQIVCAVDYVHNQGLMHRDLKPSNIFFTADEVVKVGDFGLVTALNVQQDQESEIKQTSQGRHTAEVGTTLYMSPEQITKRPYNLKIDIFSLGLIFLEMLVPFSTQMERIRTLQDAKKQIFPSRFTSELPSESELVYKMTSSDPNLRPITKEILDHPLFLEYAPTRPGTLHRKRTLSTNSIT